MPVELGASGIGSRDSNDVGSRETADGGAQITLTGTLRLVGNEPFTSMVVTTAEGESYTVPDERADAFRHLLWRQVEASGYLEERELRTADGRAIGTERTLREPEIRPLD